MENRKCCKGDCDNECVDFKEEFRDIPGYEGMYQISNLSNVKSLNRVTERGRRLKGKMLKPTKNNRGYLFVGLSKNGKQTTFGIHQLMAMVYLNHKPDGLKMVVNHKDFNILNNSVENLEIVTQRDNANMLHIDTASQYIGVAWHIHRNKWYSSISMNRKQVHIGSYKDELTAGIMYLSALVWFEKGKGAEFIKEFIKF